MRIVNLSSITELNRSLTVLRRDCCRSFYLPPHLQERFQLWVDVWGIQLACGRWNTEGLLYHW